MVGCPVKLAIGGNWSAGRPAIWNTELPDVTLTRSFPVSSTTVSAPESDRTMGTSFFDRQGDATGGRHGGFNPATNTEIQIGGGQSDGIAFGFDEDVL